MARVTEEALAAALRPETALVSIMYANNEVGTVQPIARLAALARAQGIPFHTDAVQAAGWLPLDTAALGVDALSISGHKLGAPKGSGALFVREPDPAGTGDPRRRAGTRTPVGHRKRGRGCGPRDGADAGPEPQADRAAHVAALRDDFVRDSAGRGPGAVLTGHPSERLPSVASFCFPGTSGESVLLELERLGVVCSSGSACAAGSDEPSPVLLAMGISAEVAQTAVRFSFDSTITAAELQEAAAAVRTAVGSVRALGPN